MKRLLLLLAVAGCTSTPGVLPPPLPVAAPTPVGMSADIVAKVDSIVHVAIANRVTPGAAVAIGRHGKLVLLKGYGALDYRPGFAPVTESSIYDLASLTKVVGTTTAIMMLVDEGRLDLEAPLSRYISELRRYPDKQAITVRQVLEHTAGFRAYAPLHRDQRGRRAYVRAIAEMPLEYQTGTRMIYSDFGPILLGIAVERISGQRLDRFLRKRLFEPLGMVDSYFNPPKSVSARIAPTEIDTADRGKKGRATVHDENAFALGGVSGHAGLFSSARDLARFAQMLLNLGEYGGQRIVSAQSVALFTRRQSTLSSRALGWDTPSKGSSAGEYFSARSFGHTGFTGTSIWIDPANDLYVVLLTNRVNPTRENNRHVALRIALANAVQQAVIDRAASRSH